MISWSRKRKQQNAGIPNASNRINITEQVLSEIDRDISVFPTAKHLVS